MKRSWLLPLQAKNNTPIDYQKELNLQSESIEKPLKWVSKLSKYLNSEYINIGWAIESEKVHRNNKSNSFIIPKIELSLIKEKSYIKGN